MPVFPTYDSNQTVQPRAAAPLMSGADAPLEAAKNMSKVTSDIAQKWSDANDVMQYTEAKAKHQLAIADIEARASADPDFKSSEKYAVELQAAKDNALSGIGNALVAKKAGVELDYEGKISGIKIDSQFKQKQLKYNQAMVRVNLDGLLSKKIAASTPAEAMQYDSQINELIAANLQSGTLSMDEAQKMTKDAQETSVRYEIYNDPATDEKSSALLAELKDPKGRFGFLDADTRLKMIEEDQRRIFQNNQTFKRESEASKNERFNGIFQKANEGTLTLNDLDQEMAAANNGVPGAMSQKEILDIRKGILSRVKSDLEVVTKDNDKAAEYLKFVDNFIDDETDRQKGREAIAAAYKDGILSPKEAALLNSMQREAEDISWNRGTMTNNMIPFKNAITAIGDFFRNKRHSSDTDAAKAIKDLLNGAEDGKDPAPLVDKITSEYTLKKNPQLLLIPEEGQVFMDDNGTTKRIKLINGKIKIEDIK